MTKELTPGERRREELAACFKRADLRPGGLNDDGFPLGQHYAATAFTQPSDTNWELPGARPTIERSRRR